MKLQRCIVCEEPKLEGIRLRNSFFCQACEHNMVHTEVREQKYRYYVEKLKSLERTRLHTS